MMDKLTGESRARHALVVGGVFAVFAALAFSGVAVANHNICHDTALIDNVLDPMLNAAFQIGPLLGAISGIVSLVMMSQVTSKDKKKKWKERRNDAFLYGVVGVLASGWIIDFFTKAVMDLPDGCLDTSALYNTIHLGDVAAQVLPLIL